MLLNKKYIFFIFIKYLFALNQTMKIKPNQIDQKSTFRGPEKSGLKF